MQDFKTIELIFTILLTVIILTACAERHEQNVRDSLPGYTKPDINQDDKKRNNKTAFRNA